jgi:hypothetical protein
MSKQGAALIKAAPFRVFSTRTRNCKKIGRSYPELIIGSEKPRVKALTSLSNKHENIGI